MRTLSEIILTGCFVKVIKMESGNDVLNKPDDFCETRSVFIKAVRFLYFAIQFCFMEFYDHAVERFVQ